MWQTTELPVFSRWLWLTSYIVDSHIDQFHKSFWMGALHRNGPMPPARCGLHSTLTFLR